MLYLTTKNCYSGLKRFHWIFQCQYLQVTKKVAFVPLKFQGCYVLLGCQF